MLLDAKQSLLLIIDTQENSINTIHQHEQILANCKDLACMAKAFQVPLFASEHIPAKNGPTVACLLEFIPDLNRFSKSDFSALTGHASLLKSDREQFVLAGIQTHLCVLHTAIELLEAKKQLYVVIDATDSRFVEDKQCAIERLRQLGVQIITKQMVLFEWAKNAKHPAYIKLSEQMLK